MHSVEHCFSPWNLWMQNFCGCGGTFWVLAGTSVANSRISPVLTTKGFEKPPQVEFPLQGELLWRVGVCEGREEEEGRRAMKKGEK